MTSSLGKIFYSKLRVKNDSIKVINIVTGGNLDICDKFVDKYQSFVKNHSFPHLLVLKELDGIKSISGNDTDLKDQYNIKEIINKTGCSEISLSYNDNSSMNFLFNYLEKNQYKINCILHLNHLVLLDIPTVASNQNYDNAENYNINEMLKQIKNLIKANIENPFILNNSLLNKSHLLNKTKICHLTYQSPFNVNISNYLKYNKIFIDMFNLLKSKHKNLIKEVDIKLVNIQTIDNSYIEFFKTLIESDTDGSKRNDEYFKESVKKYEKNTDKAIDFLIYLCDPNNNIKKITIDIDNI